MKKKGKNLQQLYLLLYKVIPKSGFQISFTRERKTPTSQRGNYFQVVSNHIFF